MKIAVDKLPAALNKGLAPIYLLHGDEPFLLGEAADAVRAAARAADYSDREVFDVDAGFDWARLVESASALSLFAARRLLEVRLPQGKPGDAGARALADYAARPPDDTVLMVICGKLDAAQQRTQWYKALEQAGTVVQAWPLKLSQLPGWIDRRMRERGLAPDREAVQLLAERVEGNLLACAQEIDKLVLLHGQGAIDARAVADSVADSARYSVYDLGDAVLAGEAGRAVRILNGLRAEGLEVTLVLWVLAREVRLLEALARDAAGGVDAALARHKVWERRKPLLRKALQRGGPGTWQGWLARCGHVDRVAKGVAQGRVWDELLQLTLGIAGSPLHEASTGGQRVVAGARRSTP